MELDVERTLTPGSLAREDMTEGASLLFRSWGLFTSCWRVLRSQPTLAIYPVISGIASLFFVAVFLLPLYLTGYLDTLIRQVSSTETGTAAGSVTPDLLPWQAWVIMFVLGLALNLVMNFCNAAFTAATLIRLFGSEVSVSEAFDVAASRFPAILGYSLIGATVGLVLRMIEERVGILGRLVGGLIGLAWAIVTFLVVPVLVVENVGPVEGIKRSSALLRRTWGEGLIGNVGIGMASGLLSIVCVLVGAGFVMLGVMTGLVALIVLAVVATVAGLIAIAVISRTLSGIFTAALYAYATGRGTMPGIPSELITGAFRPKSAR